MIQNDMQRCASMDVWGGICPKHPSIIRCLFIDRFDLHTHPKLCHVYVYVYSLYVLTLLDARSKMRKCFGCLMFLAPFSPN